MRVFSLHSRVWLPRPVHRVFPFFSEASNLEVLTPPWLRFQVVPDQPVEMAEGARIDYRLRVHGVRIQWQSEIVRWDPPHRFVDVQRRGPYRYWHHEHRFEERDGGTLAEDHVRYAILGGWLIDRLFVRRDLRRIFAYRRRQLESILGDEAGDGGPRGPRAE